MKTKASFLEDKSTALFVLLLLTIITYSLLSFTWFISISLISAIFALLL